MKKLEQAIGYSFKNHQLLKQALTHRSFSPNNYEKLEFVGDGILDFVIALNLFKRYPQLEVGELSKMRSKLVNQDTLAQIGLNLKLGDYLILGDGEIKSGGKTRPSILADVVEAIFAAVLLDGTVEQAKTVVEGLFVNLLSAKIDDENVFVVDYKSKLQEYLQAQKITPPNYVLIQRIGPDHESDFVIECQIPELKIKQQAQGKSKKEASQKVAQQILKIILRV